MVFHYHQTETSKGFNERHFSGWTKKPIGIKVLHSIRANIEPFRKKYLHLDIFGYSRDLLSMLATIWYILYPCEILELVCLSKVWEGGYRKILSGMISQP